MSMPVMVIFFMVDGAPRWRLQRHQPCTSHLMPSVGAVHHITLSHCRRTQAALHEGDEISLVCRLSASLPHHPARHLALSFASRSASAMLKSCSPHAASTSHTKR